MNEFFGEPTPKYGFRGFHKRNYENSVVLSDATASPNRRNNRRVVRFFSNGVEKMADNKGLVYGSGQEYAKGRRIDERTCKVYMQWSLGCTPERFSDIWSAEIVKYKRQQEEADQDIQAFKEQKRRQEEERQKEKRKASQHGPTTINRDLEMLKHHHPWGRQVGGGAPRVSHNGSVDTRLGKLDLEDNSSSQKAYNPFGRPGGGAPIRTQSGKFVTSLAGDPDIRFQKQLKKEVERSLRYKGANKDAEVHTPSKMTRTLSEIERRELEHEKKLIYARKLDEQRNESQERKKRNADKDNEINYQYNPWGRDNPSRDESGKLQRRRRGIDSRGVASEGPESEEKGWWMEGLGEPPRLPKAVKQPTSVQKDGYDPWGKPGGGAPLTSSSGNVLTGVYGNFRDKEIAEDEASLADPNRDKGHGITVAEWLRHGKVGQPRRDHNHGNTIIAQNKNTSDVTSQSLDIRRGCDPVIMSDYHADLQQQADQRQIQQERERQERLVEERRHAARLEELWPRSDIDLKKQQKDNRQRTYCEDLQQMMEDKKKEREKERQKQVLSEKEHVKFFNHLWGRPGGGAPRVKGDHQLDTSPRSYGTLTTFMTHTGQHKFRR